MTDQTTPTPTEVDKTLPLFQVAALLTEAVRFAREAEGDANRVALLWAGVNPPSEELARLWAEASEAASLALKSAEAAAEDASAFVVLDPEGALAALKSSHARANGHAARAFAAANKARELANERWSGAR